MVAIEVNVNSSIGNLKDMPKALLESGLDKTAQELIRNLMINSPVDNGLLKQWAVTDSDDTSRTVQSPAEYAGYVNYGHPQEPGRFIPGVWDGDKFEYIPGHKTGMVLKESFVEGQHFVEDSIDATLPRIQEFFTINGD